MMYEMNITEKFIDRLDLLLKEELILNIDIQKCLVDYTGVLIAGAAKLKKKHELYLEQTKLESKNGSIVVGLSKKTDVYSAALLNSLSAHVLELDDGHRFGMLHPGVTVFSALLAIALQENIRYEEFNKAAVSGYEMMIRLACMLQPVHKKRGFHASATCGTVGAAVAVAVARNYDRILLKNTISAAATGASGILEMIENDSELKPYNCAQATVNGILAANIARCGYKGPEDALGGRRGFIQSLNGAIDYEKVKRSLKVKDCVSTTYKKLYASCRHTHSAVEAALILKNKYKVLPKDIKCVNIESYDMAVFGHDNANVQSVEAAKMSIPYSVAMALVYGKTSQDAFAESFLYDEKVTSMQKKINIVINDDLSKLVPEIRAAIVSLETIEGEVLTVRVDYPKGEPENPLTNLELEEKFKSLLLYAGKDIEYINEMKNIFSKFPESWKSYLQLLAR